MKKSLKIILSIIMTLILIGITYNVNAYSATGSLTSSSKLKAGDNVEVVFSLKNIDMGGGVVALEGTLDYDENVFEVIPDNDNSIIGQNGWNVGIYSAQSKIFTATRNEGTNENGDIVKITFKVKSSISVSSTTVKIKNIEISGGEETGDISVDPVSVTLQKATDTTPTPTPTPTPTTTPSTTSTTSTTTSNNNSKEKLPQTGEETMPIVVSGIVVSIIAGIAYIKYKKLQSI